MYKGLLIDPSGGDEALKKQEIPEARLKIPQTPLPDSLDWREYGTGYVGQFSFPSICAHICFKEIRVLFLVNSRSNCTLAAKKNDFRFPFCQIFINTTLKSKYHIYWVEYFDQKVLCL